MKFPQINIINSQFINQLVFFTFLITGFNSLISAQSLKNVGNYSLKQNLLFEENKGQLAPTLKGNIGKGDIKFYAHSNGVNLYCKPGMLSFVFTKIENENNPTISEATGLPISDVGAQNFEPLHQKRSGNSKLISSRLDLILINSNPKTQITASDQQEYFENFYTTGDANHGIANVHTYKTITYNNIYSHIDMILTTNGKGMEYSFLVHPGGNVVDIKMKWNGANKINSLENGGYKFCNALGSMEESAPKTYSKGELIKSSFSKKDGYCGFNVGKYDKNKDLLIDPSLEWATYFGGGSGENGRSVCTDISGNVYINGNSYGTNGIVTSGAYQTTKSGTIVVFLAKFNNSGKLLWATYYGGSSRNYGSGICTDAKSNVFITGWTNSSNNIATSNADQSSLAGNGTTYDAFLAKFNDSGALTWATYYGGSENDYGGGVSADTSGNIYITGYTNSTDIKVTKKAFQEYSGGSYDAFLAKFSSFGKMIWGTYFGGKDDDFSVGVATDNYGNVTITGGAWSSNLATSGAFQTNIAGQNDVFLAQFNSSGVLNWATYYGGNNNDDVYGMCVDISGNIYITGQTNSDWGLASSGSHQSSFAGGNGDAFLAKFNEFGNLTWATYFGSNNFDYGSGVAVDIKGNIYITGNTSSISGIATSGAYQTLFGGGQYDAFLAMFRNSGILSWATYYGGYGWDDAMNVITDPSGNVFFTGSTDSYNGISTLGAFQTSSSHNEDAFLIKFLNKTYQNDAGIDSIINPNIFPCSGKQKVIVKLRNFGSGSLNNVKISWSVNGKAQPVYNWKGTLLSGNSEYVILDTFYVLPNYDTIKVWTIMPNGQYDSLSNNDTFRLIVSAFPLPKVILGKNRTICNGDTTSIGAILDSNENFSWSTYPFDGIYHRKSLLVVKPKTTTTYILTVYADSTGCANSDSIKITVNPSPLIVLIPEQSICIGNSISLGASAVIGSNYTWTSNPTVFTSSSYNPVIIPTVTTVYKLTETITATGCSNTDSVKVTVNPLPIPNPGTDQSICNGKSVSIGSPSTIGTSYSWISTPLGFTSTISNPNDSPKVSTIYKLTETITATGCSNSDSVKVIVNPLPFATVVSATTICNGSSIALGSSSESGHNYYWTSNPSGFSSNIADPIITPKFTTSYKLKEVNSLTGCEESDSVIITVNNLPDASWSITNVSKYYNFLVIDSSLSKSSYMWSFGDGTYFTGYGVSHVFPRNSTFSIKLTVTNTNGCIAEHDSTINVIASGISIPASVDIYHLNIYPNPFQSSTTIEYNLLKNDNIKISLIDMQGKQIIILNNEYQMPGNHQFDINSEKYKLNPGIYLLKFMIDDEIISKQLVKF